MGVGVGEGMGVAGWGWGWLRSLSQERIFFKLRLLSLKCWAKSGCEYIFMNTYIRLCACEKMYLRMFIRMRTVCVPISVRTHSWYTEHRRGWFNVLGNFRVFRISGQVTFPFPHWKFPGWSHFWVPFGQRLPHAHRRTHAYMYTCTRSLAHTYTCTHTYLGVLMCIHTYIHTCIDAYIHTYIRR